MCCLKITVTHNLSGFIYEEKMSRQKEILCLSGGLDSVIAWYYLGKPPTVYFHTNLPHCDKELHCVQRLTGMDTIIDKSLDFSSEKEIYIPHRNLLFASRASVYAKKVWIAGLKDDMVEDKNEDAFSMMSLCLSTVGKETVFVESPFWQKTKTDIVMWFKHKYSDSMDVDRLLNEMSISCYGGGDKPCYQCESCFRKACAMFNAGLSYKFDNFAMIKEYRVKALQNKYVMSRNLDIIKFTNMYIPS